MLLRRDADRAGSRAAAHPAHRFRNTAWRISMDRRQVAESANAALKGSFVDVSRGFFRALGRVKVSVLLGFTAAAHKLDRIRSFRAKQAEVAGAPKRQPKRSRGTWGPDRNRALSRRRLCRRVRPAEPRSVLQVAVGPTSARPIGGSTRSRSAITGLEPIWRPMNRSENATNPRRVSPRRGICSHKRCSFMNTPEWRWRESNPRAPAS